MKIGIIGAGHVGSAVAKQFVKAGHEVALSNSKGPQSLDPLIKELGRKARAAKDKEEAARFGDIVFLAIPWREPEAFPSPESVKGKIVIDATNPYRADMSIEDLGDLTSSEIVQRRLPGARIVKAFNTMYAERQANGDRQDLPKDERLALFIASDDAEAKKVVSDLVEQIGFAPVDTGSLREGGRRQQPGAVFYAKPLTGKEADEILARQAHTVS